jgi:hypothetical protein
MTTTNTQQDPLFAEKERVFTYVKNFLGDGMIDIEADPAHLETGLEKALAVYRQRSQNAVEESYCFLDLVIDQNEYILPKEIKTVREVFRRSIGSRTGGGDGGTLFEPFNLAYTNTYLLSATNMGGLATYYMFGAYQKLVGKMFGSFINFTFHPTTHKLTIMQRPQSTERVLLWVYNDRPDIQILQDTYAGIWVRDYTLAMVKIMIGQAREKFSQIASPTGGVQLNGQSMKQEGQTQADKLEEELKKGDPSSQGAYTFVIG